MAYSTRFYSKNRTAIYYIDSNQTDFISKKGYFSEKLFHNIQQKSQ